MRMPIDDATGDSPKGTSRTTSQQSEATTRLPSTEEQILAVRIGEVTPLTGPIQIVDYDPEWPGLFEREAERIQAAPSHPHRECRGQEQDDYPIDDQSYACELADLPTNGQRFLCEDQRRHQCHDCQIHDAERKEDDKEQPAATEAKGPMLNPHSE